MTLWRMDDIIFAGKMEGRLLIQDVFEELAQLFATHGGRLTLGVITRYGWG